MTSQQPSCNKEIFIRSFHGIPDDEQLKSMSFAELASELSSSDPGSPKFMVIEREMKKHIAKDQAKSNRSNIILGACIGLVGVVIGGFIRSTPPCDEVSTSNTVQQIKSEKLPMSGVAPIVKTNPEPVKNNAHPSQNKP